MLYIRHGPKLYANGGASTYGMDPGLHPSGKQACVDKFTVLVNKYGAPPKIYCSPYLRARETAAIAQEVIAQHTGVTVEIVPQARLGEYLGHQKRCNLTTDLRPETLAHNPIPPETWKDYGKRVRTMIPLSQKGWHISHGIVIKSITHFLGTEIEYPSELSGFIMNNNKLELV